MPRGGFREGAGRPKSGRKVRTIRATDEEWKLIKAYAEQLKAGKSPEILKRQEIKQVEVPKPVVKKKAKSTKKLGQLEHATFIFGNPDKIKYGCFFCIPEGEKYAIKAYFCPTSEAPTKVWDALDKVIVTYGYLVPATNGWIWKNAEGQNILGPDPERLSRKKTIKAAFAYWLSDLLLNQNAIRAKELQERQSILWEKFLVDNFQKDLADESK